MLDDTLNAFDDLKTAWSAILVGNGASRAISEGFAYKSLFDKAQSTQVEHPLTAREKAVFEQMGTRNFEQVLSALAQTEIIGGIFDLDTSGISKSYARTQEALLEAVHGVHLAWAEVPSESLEAIREALLNYDFVYSTNYDLLIYWSVMTNHIGFKDYFFQESFDLSNSEIRGKCTKLLYLHGGLHLYRSKRATTKRRTGNLLTDFGKPINGEVVVPLFITEGKSEDKLRSIYSNDYLSFAYSKFAHENGPLVILGQSLDEAFDKHLITAIRSSARKKIGIGIYPPDARTNAVAALKGSWYAKLPNLDLNFFDSRTHPLTKPEMCVP